MTAEALEHSVHLRRPHPMQEQFPNSPAKRIVIRHPRDSVMRITDRTPPLRPRVSSPLGLPLRVLSAAPTARGRVFWQSSIHPPGCSRALESFRACLQARKLVQDVIDESPPEGSVFVLSGGRICCLRYSMRLSMLPIDALHCLFSSPGPPRGFLSGPQALPARGRPGRP
jgi:hypothetical protein